MLNLSGQGNSFQHVRSLNTTNSTFIYPQSKEFQVALEDARREMADDPLLEQLDSHSLLDDDFGAEPYIHRESWDAFEIQALSAEIVAQ